MCYRAAWITLHDPHRVFVFDFVDFSIYVDADKNLLKEWYIQRFLRFRRAHSPIRRVISTTIPISMRMMRLPLPAGSGTKSIIRI